jgi:hypothetical protein
VNYLADWDLLNYGHHDRFSDDLLQKRMNLNPIAKFLTNKFESHLGHPWFAFQKGDSEN